MRSACSSAPASIKAFPGNSPANATIVLTNLSAPSRPAACYAGDTWQFNAINPSDDQPLPANPYSWDVVFHHRTHTHPFLSGLSGPGGQFSIPTIGESNSQVWYEVVLRLTDAEGQISTISKDLTPATTTLNFNTAPSGGALLLDGSAFITPFSVTRVVGLQDRHQRARPAAVSQNSHHLHGLVEWGGPILHLLHARHPAEPHRHLPRPVQRLGLPVLSR